MPTFLDFMERATEGPILSDDAFNMQVLLPNVARIVKEYGIRYNREEPLSSDDEMADRLFEAAVEFLVESGVYCNATNRVIQVDREEIVKAVADLPGESTFGEGQDRRVFKARNLDDPSPPWCFVGGGIAASSEEVAMAQVEGYGSIPQANGISIPPLAHVKGMPAIGGSPLEIYASISSVQLGRKALWKCGRPGLPIMNLVSASTSAVGTIAATFPTFGLRPSDGWLIDVIAEMRVDFETLNRLAFVLSIGGNVGSTALPILGGYAGGPEGTSLVMTTCYLLGMLLLKGSYHLTCPIHFRYGCSSTRECMWVYSMVGRATSRHMRYPDLANGYAAAGPCTRMYFYEAAAVNLCCVASGYGGVETVHPAKAVVEDGITPMEARFCTEVAHAAAGMKAERANEIVQQLLEKYEREIENAPQGKRYQECYDLKTGKPHEDYVRLYGEVKAELSKMGVPFQA